MKKQYIKPAMKAIKLESTDIICGSGDGIQTMSLGNSGDSDAPELSGGPGNNNPTGFWGESNRRGVWE